MTTARQDLARGMCGPWGTGPQGLLQRERRGDKEGANDKSGLTAAARGAGCEADPALRSSGKRCRCHRPYPSGPGPAPHGLRAAGQVG